MTANVFVAFIGKQDPINDRGGDGPILSAFQEFGMHPDALLLLYVEGASDRADGRNDALAYGTQHLRAEAVRDALLKQWPNLEVVTAELGDDPSHAEALLAAFRASHEVKGFREAWRSRATLHTLPSSGTPAMRELLSTLAVMRFFDRTRSWYASDRGSVREEFPLAAQAVSLSGAVSAVRLGEYAVAAEQVQAFTHAAPVVGDLLVGLQAYRDGEYREALRVLRRWAAPEIFQGWQRDAVKGLTLMTGPGALMALWNEVQAASPRNAVLAYATLLETALQALLAEHRLPGREESVGSIVNRLRGKGVDVPDALDARAGTPEELYARRNAVIHRGRHVTVAEAVEVRDAATDLLRSYPAEQPELKEFLRAPHHNAFAPQRRPELADLLHHHLII